MILGIQVAAIAVVASLLTGGLVEGAFAHDRDKDWSATVGLKVWRNQWETGRTNIDPSTGNNYIISLTSAEKYSLIPSLAVRYKDVFVSGGYFTKTSYSFPEISVAGTRSSLKADRTEADVNVGWFPFSHVGAALTVGYKTVKEEYETSFAGSAATTRDSIKYRGATFGLLASGRMSETFTLYAHGTTSPWFKAKNSDGQSEAGWYRALEFGITWRVTKGAALTLGPKQEWIKTFLGDQTRTDSTTGFALGANYTF